MKLTSLPPLYKQGMLYWLSLLGQLYHVLKTMGTFWRCSKWHCRIISEWWLDMNLDAIWYLSVRTYCLYYRLDSYHVHFVFMNIMIICLKELENYEATCYTWKMMYVFASRGYPTWNMISVELMLLNVKMVYKLIFV